MRTRPLTQLNTLNYAESDHVIVYLNVAMLCQKCIHSYTDVAYVIDVFVCCNHPDVLAIGVPHTSLHETAPLIETSFMYRRLKRSLSAV